MRIALMMLLIVCVPLVVCAGDPLDDWRLTQLSANDRLAVLQSPTGELLLVREGDRLGEELTIVGFDGERLVIERPGEWGRDRLFVSLAQGRETVERLERRPLRRSAVSGARAAITAGSAGLREDNGGALR